MSTTKELSPSLARALVRSLTRGTAVAEGARFINVGQDDWLAAQQELLDEVAEDGHSETKFVRGAYGSGKSHFLSVVQDHARDRNWVTAHVECKVDRVEIDRFETLYPRIASKLLMSDLIDARTTPLNSDLDAMRFLLERWTNRLLHKIGVREDAITRPFDAEHRLYAQFQKSLLRSTQSSGFVQAVMAFARAQLARDPDMATAICSWMRGSNEMLRIPPRYLRHPNAPDESKTTPVQIRPIGAGTAHDAMRGLLWLVRDAGYAGLILCVDEVEELARLRSQTRQDQALQALREFVDHGGGEGGFKHLCMYLAATPEMFESERYFPRYDALATRIQPLSDGINWRGPVVDLEKTPLDEGQMRRVAERILRVFRTAYGQLGGGDRLGESIGLLVSAVMTTRYRIAKPRLLARMLIDELERARAQDSAYEVPSDLAAVVSRTAGVVASERDAP
jgi:P-loop Domain of unknown function (DUF2791)